MKIGIIGLGRMGLAIAQQALEKGHTIVAYNRSSQPVEEIKKAGAQPAHSIQQVIEQLPVPRIVWVMVTASAVDDILAQIEPHLVTGDVIIDGGNSFYKDSQRRYQHFEKKGIHFLDCGTSGGIEGARHGACVMVGGNKEAFQLVEPFIKDISTPNGYGYMGTSGAGHFVKMVHNGIEYGMMGALNEGFEALQKHSTEFSFYVQNIAQVYAHGSIIESRLMSWLYESFQTPAYLEKISCEVPKGETEEEMFKLTQLSTMPILQQAIYMREQSRKKGLCCRYIAAMRNQFGGHKFNETHRY